MFLSLIKYALPIGILKTFYKLVFIAFLKKVVKEYYMFNFFKPKIRHVSVPVSFLRTFRIEPSSVVAPWFIVRIGKKELYSGDNEEVALRIYRQKKAGDWFDPSAV